MLMLKKQRRIDMSNIDYAVVNKLCKKCGQSMVQFSGGYKCLTCGVEYSNKEIQSEVDKLKEKGMR